MAKPMAEDDARNLRLVEGAEVGFVVNQTRH